MIQAFKAGLPYFAIVFGGGFLFGIIRTLWIAPRIGTRAADLMESPFMLVVIICSARWILHRPGGTGEALRSSQGRFHRVGIDVGGRVHSCVNAAGSLNR